MRISHYEKGYRYTARELLMLAKKIGRLTRYCKRIMDESSVIKVETVSRDTKKQRDSVKVMVIIRLPKKTLRAESRRKDALSAIDRCCEKLESQIEKYKSRHVALLLFLLLFPFASFAQTEEPPEPPPELRAVITGPKEVQVGKTIVLDGSLSTADSETVSYLWTRDGDVISRTEEALMTLEKPGRYEIMLRVRDRLGGEQRESEGVQEIAVYLRKLLLVAGPTVSKEKLDLHRMSGEEIGVFVDVLHREELPIPLGTEDALAKLVAENAQKLLLFWHTCDPGPFRCAWRVCGYLIL